jgi:hypothetical protein
MKEIKKAESVKVYIDDVEQNVNALQILQYMLDSKTGKIKHKELEA